MVSQKIWVKKDKGLRTKKRLRSIKTKREGLAEGLRGVYRGEPQHDETRMREVTDEEANKDN